MEFPIIVFIDSHSANMVNIATWEFCEEREIILYCLPPRASQPLNVSVFRAVTKYWHQSLDNFANNFRNISLNKTHFFQVSIKKFYSLKCNELKSLYQSPLLVFYKVFKVFVHLFLCCIIRSSVQKLEKKVLLFGYYEK